MEPRELVDLKLAMEFGVAPEGETLPPARLNADGLPRLLVSRFAGGEAIYFRFDVDRRVRDELRALGTERLMTDESQVRSILDRTALVEKLYRVRWYTIERLPQPVEYPDATFQDGRYVVLVDGKVAAWAQTDAESPVAAEVSIETLEAYQRRGFARQVTAAWAAGVLSAGKVAYYSHLLHNTASQAVAASLGLTHLSDEVEYI
ncbi:MAG TPA: GNAT family N-acetyltransferase [Thermomicrobiales bacterium]|nr:GNAT family N-acetyltransferase [Thermomicrobiales bacterium]